MKYEFGEVTKLLMSSKGLSVRGLSEKTGIDEEYLGYCLSNRIMPSMKEIKAIASVLEVSPTFLASGVDNTRYPSRKCSSFKASYSIAKSNVNVWTMDKRLKMIKLMVK